MKATSKTITLSEAKSAFRLSIQGLTLAMVKAGLVGRCTRDKILSLKLPGGSVKAPGVSYGRLKTIKYQFTFKRDGVKWAGVVFKPVAAMLLPNPLVFSVAIKAGEDLLTALDAVGDYLTPYIDTYRLVAKVTDSREYGLKLKMGLKLIEKRLDIRTDRQKLQAINAFWAKWMADRGQGVLVF